MPELGFTPGLGFLQIKRPVPRRFFDSGKPAVQKGGDKRSSWDPIMYPEGVFQILEKRVLGAGSIRPRVLLRLEPVKSATHPGAVEFEDDPNVMEILPDQGRLL